MILLLLLLHYRDELCLLREGMQLLSMLASYVQWDIASHITGEQLAFLTLTNKLAKYQGNSILLVLYGPTLLYLRDLLMDILYILYSIYSISYLLLDHALLDEIATHASVLKGIYDANLKDSESDSVLN